MNQSTPIRTKKQRNFTQPDQGLLFVAEKSNSTASGQPSKALINRHVQRNNFRRRRENRGPSKPPQPVIMKFQATEQEQQEIHRRSISASSSGSKTPDESVQKAPGGFDPFDSLATTRPLNINEIFQGHFFRLQDIGNLETFIDVEEELRITWQLAMLDEAWYHTLAAAVSLSRMIDTGGQATSHLQHRTLGLKAMQRALQAKSESKEGLMLAIIYHIDWNIEDDDVQAANFHAAGFQLLSAITPMEKFYYGNWETMVCMYLRYAIWADQPMVSFTYHPTCGLEEAFKSSFDFYARQRAAAAIRHLTGIQYDWLDAMTLFSVLRRCFLANMIWTGVGLERGSRAVLMGVWSDLCYYNSRVKEMLETTHPGSTSLEILRCMLLTVTLATWANTYPWIPRDSSYRRYKVFKTLLGRVTEEIRRYDKVECVSLWKKHLSLECFVWVLFTAIAWSKRSRMATEHELEVLAFTLKTLGIKSAEEYAAILLLFPTPQDWVDGRMREIYDEQKKFRG